MLCICIRTERQWDNEFNVKVTRTNAVITNANTSNSMEMSVSCEVNRSSDSLEIPHILWSHSVYYSIHDRWLPVPIQSQINTVHASPFQLLKIHYNLILPAKHIYCKCSVSLRFLHQTSVWNSPVPHIGQKSRPSHSSCFDAPINIW